MENLNPFDLKEVLITLFTSMDVRTLKKMFQSYQHLLNDPHVLKKLAVAFDIPLTFSKYHHGQRSVLPIVTSFADLIFEMELRDPIERKKSCLTASKMIIIAIEEEDLRLVEVILQECWKSFSAVEIEMASGKTGNFQLYQLLENYFSPCREFEINFLRGLIRSHHNSLAMKFIEEISHRRALRLNIISEEAGYANNVTLYNQYFDQLEADNVLIDALRPAAENSSIEIIEMYFTNNGRDERRPPNREESRLLLLGYAAGGHTEKFVTIYNSFGPRDESNDFLCATHAWTADDPGCYLFLSEIYPFFLTELLISTKVIGTVKMSGTIKHLVDRSYLSWVTIYDEIAISEHDFAGLVELTNKYDQNFERGKRLLQNASMVPKHTFNECFLKWLRLQILIQ